MGGMVEGTEFLATRVARVATYLQYPELLWARFRGLRVDFVHAHLELRRRWGLAPATVIDVGADRGEFIAAAKYAYPQATVLAFEVRGAARLELQRRFALVPSVKIFPYGLAEVPGRRQVHVSGAGELSSLLPPTVALGDYFGTPGSEFTQDTAEVTRFDEVVDLAEYPQPILLKLDVQGAELDVLRGFGAQLAAVQAIRVEVTFAPFYQGQTPPFQLVSFLRASGFERFVQDNLHERAQRPEWCDLLFLR